MSERPAVLLLGASRERHARAAAILAETAIVRTDLGAVSQAQAHPRVVLVDLADDLERGLRTVEEVRHTIAQAQVVALAGSKDPDVILRAMRAGACEFAVLGESTELEDVVKTLLQRGTSETSKGTITSIFAAKGGIGATTLAVNLACALAARGRRVLLVDLDRHLGDVLAFLDMAPGASLADVAQNLHRLDRDLLLSSLARHPSGPFLLAQPDALEDREALGASQMTAVLQLAARHFDDIVCDGLRGFDELAVAALDASSRVELVLTQDVIALKNAKRCLEIFNRLGYDREKVELVINGFHAKAAIDRAAMHENLGHEVRAVIAADERAAIAALNRGLPIASVAPQSAIVRDIAALADALSGAPAKEKPRGFLNALFRDLRQAPIPRRDAEPLAK